MFAELLSSVVAHMRHRPDAPALVTPDRVVSFGALARRVAGIRADLSAGAPGRVLILGHKAPDCVAAMLACALEGRGFIFADRSYPVARIARMAVIGGARRGLVVGEAPEGLGLPMARLDTIPDADPDTAPDPTAVDDAAVLYIIFTSGSTGMPKGVPISRANFAALHRWYTPLLGQAPEGAHVNHSSFAFDMGMFDLWPPLALGRPVVLLDHGNNIFPLNNLRQLDRVPGAGPSSWASTPSLLQLMCTDPRFDAARFAQLRFFVIGGEMLPRPLIRELRARFPEARLTNGYGPSEATCCTHLAALEAADAQGSGPLPVGPVAGANRMRILDEDGAELPPGETGEVELSGPQVVAGYLPGDHPANRAFGSHAGQRSYRSGDLGRIGPDGSLTLLGRIDRQVKWLGNRIELDEIERAADDCAGVRKSACVPLREDGRVVSIVLFVQPAPEGGPGREALVAHLGSRLPPAMIPRDLRFVPVLPVTVNGKVDARALIEGLLPDPA